MGFGARTADYGTAVFLNGERRQRQHHPVLGKWGFPEIWGTLLGVPIIRTIVYWGQYWGTLILGYPYFGKLPSSFSRVRVRGWFRYIAACNSNVRLSDVSLFDATTGPQQNHASQRVQGPDNKRDI